MNTPLPNKHNEYYTTPREFKKLPTSLARITKFIIVVLFIQIIMGISLVWSLWQSHKLIERIETGYFSAEEINQDEIRLQTLGEAISAIKIIFLITFLIWFFRAYSNGIAFSETKLRNTPVRAIIHFFIPIINLIYPYNSMVEIYRSSLHIRYENFVRTLELNHAFSAPEDVIFLLPSSM